MAAELDFTTFRNVIDGKVSVTETTRHGINPATGQPNPEVPVATPADVDAAVEAGQRAFKTWSKTSWEERRKALSAFADGLAAHQEQFTKLLIQEQGKPVRLSLIAEDFVAFPCFFYVLHDGKNR